MDGILSWFDYISGRPDEILEETWAHALIVLTAILAAAVFSVLLGILVQRRPVLRAAALSITGIFLTIPSLALFAIFIPIVGVGNRPAIYALFLYSLLPILRNTVTGLDAVPPAVVESARGMGMGPLRQLLQVRLPLAWPIMMTGIRIATLMTVGIAAIAVLVGGDGLGSYIQGGLTRLGLPNSLESVWTGTVFTVLLGLVLDIVLAAVQRATTSRGQRI
ncbi:ABC transporter permease [Phycicoccus endophyticus]|uniref:ABC transporter permease n=1 Tax=Phycicoccus endophyticus TaxID=1690220 RepID=A0A7G9R071_9MICO|nr:ABC transporter permease [Phycicoccus endophyticus]NHI20208.1 ABC transporter permease [Phycicoccus endophyticus]QNN48996.1 ABC transporter permease [Phycicoccus endophyticus]GGL44401.1 ABC transporter permease [Phycicoccus endophyticus]